MHVVQNFALLKKRTKQAMNKVKENIEEKVVRPRNKKSFLSSYIKPLLDGTFLSKEKNAKELPFIGFILFLVIIFISNTFLAQNTVRKITRYKKEVKELRLKSISVKSKLMDNTRQTQVAQRVQNLGLHESLVPPKKIYVSKKDKSLK